MDEKTIREDIPQIVDKIISLIEKAPKTRIRGKIEVKTIIIGKSGEWKYVLNIYQPTKDITLTLKRYEKQPASYAILKLTDKITEVEDLESFLKKMERMYLILDELKRRIARVSRGEELELI